MSTRREALEQAEKAFIEATVQERKVYRKTMAPIEKTYAEAAKKPWFWIRKYWVEKAFAKNWASAMNIFNDATTQARKEYEEARAQAEKLPE